MVRVINLDEKVRDALRQQILSGHLSGGAHLSELKISKEFDVSRTPVREALCALAADGLVEMIPHRGAFVKEVKKATTQHTYQAYSFVMGAYAALACDNGTIESTMAVENAITAAQNASNSSFVGSLQTVFETLSNAAGNPVLDDAMTSITRRFGSTSNLFGSATKNMAEVKQQLSFLAGAIKRNKGDVAEKTMRQLIASLTA